MASWPLTVLGPEESRLGRTWKRALLMLPRRSLDLPLNLFGSKHRMLALERWQYVKVPGLHWKDDETKTDRRKVMVGGEYVTLPGPRARY